jgi:hypothetical protein
MKSCWKRVFVWSSLGSILVGSAIALAKRARAPQSQPLDSQRIPNDCQRVSLWTEQFRAVEDDGNFAVQDKYVLQTTPFKVWSVFEGGSGQIEQMPTGATVYHVTQVRYAGDVESEDYPDEGHLQDRFYGTITTVSQDGTSSPQNHLARGGILEICKCVVGGATNGVDTGEVHHSAAPILNYRFEYSAR